MGFPDSSIGKESACIVGDLGSISGLGRFPGEGNGYPLQYSGLENSMDCIVHGVAKSQTRLCDFYFSLYPQLLWACPQSLQKNLATLKRVQISFVMSDKTSTQTEAAYITPSTRIQSKHMAAYNCLHLRKNPNTECFSL